MNTPWNAPEDSALPLRLGAHCKEEQMRTLMWTLATAACLGLAAPAAADNVPARQSGLPTITGEMLEKAQFVSSQKKTSKKKKVMTKRSSWGG
jgi:hypothetical protein